VNCAEFGFDEGRLAKRERLRQREEEPYTYGGTRPIGELPALETSADPMRVAGRFWSRRAMGKVQFADLRDRSGQIQLYFARDRLENESWDCLAALDLGDLIGAEGKLFRTRTGELSIAVETWSLLAKALVPIPIGKDDGERTYHQMDDPETRYRERHLHWLVDGEDRERIARRSLIASSLRRRMEEVDFLEVDTPVISTIYGGAEARPFRTEIWALDHQPAFLRISPELHLKRYLVAGFERVFTLCANFRNEGIDRTHNPEFSMVEWYEAYTDYEDQMRRCETLVAGICTDVLGSTRHVYQDVELDFAPPWERLTMLEAGSRYAGIDAGSASLSELRTALDQRGITSDRITNDRELSWGEMVAEIFEAECVPQLIQPTLVVDHPREISPLTRVKRGDERLVERFEAYVCGMELANAYSELTDPVEQIERFQAQRGADGPPLDRDFVRALGCGMPPAGGVGLGFDRLVMLLTDAPSIRDIIPFPLVKPRRD